MILKIYLKDDFKIGTPYLKPENSPGPLTEYSTGALVVLLDYLASSLYFTWVNPTNRKFEERALYRAAELDEAGRYAYKATIFPIMTVGLARQDSAFSMVSFREGGKLSPYIKIPVVRSIYPEQTEIPPTAVDEINAEINDIKQDIHEITARQPINQEVLDKLSEQEGKLLYEGQPIETEIPNREVLEKLSEQGGVLMFNGNPIEGGSGDFDEEHLYIDLLSALGLTPVNPNMPEVLDGGNWATTIFTYHLDGGISW